MNRAGVAKAAAVRAACVGAGLAAAVLVLQALGGLELGGLCLLIDLALAILVAAQLRVLSAAGEVPPWRTVAVLVAGTGLILLLGTDYIPSDLG